MTGVDYPTWAVIALRTGAPSFRQANHGPPLNVARCSG